MLSSTSLLCCVFSGDCAIVLWLIFFFKQKTAYEKRISDWSSNGCSSDRRGWRSPTPFVLSLSKHRPSYSALKERTALRQAQGERNDGSASCRACLSA